MTELLVVLSAVLPVLGIVAVGLLLRRLEWLTEEADHSMLRVNINLLFPCLILDTGLGNPALSRAGNLLLPPLVGFGTVVLGLLMGLAVGRALGMADARQRGTFAVTVGVYNYAYVPLPLSFLLFTGAETAGVLFVHNIGVEAAMWTLGVMLLSGEGALKDWRKLINAPLIGTALVLVTNGLHLDGLVPDAVRTGVKWLGQCAIPMSLILIGAVMADHLGVFRASAGWRVILAAVVLRVVILPPLFLLLARYLPASLELKRVMVLEAAMPSAVFPIVMARHYGGDPATALRVVIGTSLVGLVTIPLWIRFGLEFLGI